MGFQIDMSPLERSSRYIGQSLANAGQSIGGALIDRQGRITQAQQGQDSEEQVQDLLQRSMLGDSQAFQELMAKSPQAARMVAEQLQRQQATQKQDEIDFNSERSIKTAKFVEQMYRAPKEQQAEMFELGLNDDSIDLDEGDRVLSQDKKAQEDLITRAALATMDPKAAKVYLDRFFGGDATPMTEYQSEMVKGSAIDRELRKSEIENKKIDNQLKRETSAVKLAELKNKKIANEEKQFQIKKNRSDSAQSVVDSGKSTLELITSIENHPGFESAVGAKGVSSLFGAVDPFSGTDAAGVNALIETLEAQNFLTAIGEFKSAGGAGSLSDNEGKKLGAALSNLSASQSEVDFKKSLTVIKNLVNKQVSKARPQVSKKFSLEPSATNQKNTEVDLSKLSLEELKALRAKG